MYFVDSLENFRIVQEMKGLFRKGNEIEEEIFLGDIC